MNKRFSGEFLQTVVMGYRYPRKPKLFQGQQIFFTLADKESPLITSLNILEIEQVVGFDTEAFVTMPKKIFRTIRINAASGITVAVLLSIRVDNIPAIKPDLHFPQSCLRHPGSCKLIYQAGSKAISVLPDFIINVFNRIFRLSSYFILVRNKTGNFIQGDPGNMGKPKGKSSGYTTIQAAKIAIKEALSIQINYNSATLKTMIAAKRTISI